MGKLDESEIDQIEQLRILDVKLDRIIKESGYSYPGIGLSDGKKKNIKSSNLRKSLTLNMKQEEVLPSATEEFNIFGHGVQAYFYVLN